MSAIEITPVCVFSSTSSFLCDFMHRSLTVSGQRKRDKKKWFFLPWSPPSTHTHTPHPHPTTTTSTIPPSRSPQTGRVTGLQCKPLFTLAVILQVIKTTWSSPTISPLNARCVMTSWLPLPPSAHIHYHTHAITHTHIHYLSTGQGVIWKLMYSCLGHLNMI